MCGIYIYPDGVCPNKKTESSVSRRGPDARSKTMREGYVFNHALLSLNAGYALQPLNKESITVLFNGEIYNLDKLGHFQSEVECIAALYEEFYLELPRHLDGEYVIIVFDWSRTEAIIFTDIFGTKPMFLNLLPEGIELASVPSVNERAKGQYSCDVPANSVTVISLSSKKIKARFNHFFFELDQNITHFDYWTESFVAAVKKRIPSVRPSNPKEEYFIGMSSGYDSGCIAATLQHLGEKFNVFTIMSPKIWDDVIARSRVLRGNINHVLLRDEREAVLGLSDIEFYKFNIFSIDGTYKEANTSTISDSGARGLALVCYKARSLGYRVYLSGSGADEIYSDYGFQGRKIFRHSNFGGLFNPDLRGLFPWPSFYGSSMRAYLMKEELVAGSFGIEARYPFLDADLTQQWLSLTSKVKNYAYKGALENLMQTFNFPFKPSEKLGF